MYVYGVWSLERKPTGAVTLPYSFIFKIKPNELHFTTYITPTYAYKYPGRTFSALRRKIIANSWIGFPKTNKVT